MFIKRNMTFGFFEELSLYMKMEIIESHRVVFCRDLLELHEYFYQFGKIWKDQMRRNKLTKDDILNLPKTIY